jgi:hypothetical protein
MWLLLCQIASAQHVVEIGPELAPERASGTFARPFWTESTGWMLGWGTTSGYRVAPFDLDTGQVGQDTVVTTTDAGDMRDYALVPCDDGGWLVLGSQSQVTDDDTGAAFLLNADLSLRSWGFVEAAFDDRRHNDAPAICTGPLRGAVYANEGMEEKGNVFFHLDEDVNVTSTDNIGARGRISGGSLVWDDERQELTTLTTGFENELLITRYDGDLLRLGEQNVHFAFDDLRPYWPQAGLIIEDRLVVAHMLKDQDWPQDLGDLALTILDMDGVIVEQHRLTHTGDTEGGQRPGLWLKDDQLLVAYDRGVKPVVLVLTLDLQAFDDPEPQDTDDTDADTDDSSPGDDTGGDTGIEGPGPCGCGGGPAGGWLVVLLAGLAVRRRRG